MPSYRILRQPAAAWAATVCLALSPVQAHAPLDLRVALVIGNGAYLESPLRNPANDARAMGETLRGMGFDVLELRDARLDQVREAVGSLQRKLDGRFGTAVFYYAGHGLQLDWHNYLVPVNARFTEAADVPRQALDVAEVVEALKKAKTRTNVLVLDACRDNPFGKASSGKGLAQMDAPAGTFLAYATGPGNTADDGDAGNGLYTQHLLQELARPSTRIEDVFKRTRWAVRRSSLGRQIPWESTSLEDDFHFRATESAALSPEEREQDFQVQLERWTRIQKTMDLAVLESFLVDFPSGPFSELALFRYNRLQRQDAEQREAAEREAALRREREAESARLASQERLRVEEGVREARLREEQARAEQARLDAVPRPRQDSDIVPLERNYRVGAVGEYQESSWKAKSETRHRMRITALSFDTVELNNGQALWDAMGNVLRNSKGQFEAPRQFFPAELQVGKRWTTRVAQLRDDGAERALDLNGRVLRRERLTVPAGTFDTYLIVMTGYQLRSNGDFPVEWKIWVAPGVPFDIATEFVRRNPFGQLREMETRKLVALQR
jgi:hypothetical protein